MVKKGQLAKKNTGKKGPFPWKGVEGTRGFIWFEASRRGLEGGLGEEKGGPRGGARPLGDVVKDEDGGGVGDGLREHRPEGPTPGPPLGGGHRGGGASGRVILSRPRPCK